MRRWNSIARATALEMLSEPLSLLLLVTALVLVTLAPAFHYHQFGEATRMSRDAGFSALFLFGGLVTVFGAIKSFRREIETGTAQMALAHPVSRPVFFLAKTFGVAVAGAVFDFVIAATVMTVVNGAAIGGALASSSGDIPRIWGPSLAVGIGTIILPLVVAAALNRFGRFRFVLTFFACAFVLAAAGACYRFDWNLLRRLAPVAFLIAVTTVTFFTAAAAAAVRFKANGAACAVGVLVAFCLPAVGNFYLPDALAKGGELPWRYVAMATATALPCIAAFLIVGVRFFNGKDME